jgi:uncharacterized protein YqhQ
VTSEVVAAPECLLTDWTGIVSRLVRLPMSAGMPFEIFRVSEPNLAFRAVVLVSLDRIMGDFMMSGLHISNALLST